MLVSYKYRLKDSHRKDTLRQMAWAVNQVWNFCVETQRKSQTIHKQGVKKNWPGRFDLNNLTQGTSKELGVHAQTVQATCKQFAESRDQHKKCPKFRSSGGSKRSLGWIPFSSQGRRIEGNSVFHLGKRFRFFGEKKRPVPTNATGGHFFEDSRGHWYVSFCVEVPDNLPTGQGEVGIDLGLKTLATLSTSEKIENPKTFKKFEERLAVAQRAGNRKRTKAIHAKISNIRKDHLHKASAKIASENKLIVVGNVSSPKLTKTRFAKSVFDAGWGGFKTMLAYKARRHQAEFKVIDESFTSQTCSTCGCLPPSRPRGIAGLGIRDWVCSDCGATHDRDVNAALNILSLGRGVAPHVDGSRIAG